MSQYARVGKRLPVINNVTVTRTVLQSQDIGSWRSAINQARDIYVPRRKLLQELYENIVLDGHLQSVMMKRTAGITNKRIDFVARKAGQEGVVNEAVEHNVLRTPWFHDLLEGAMSETYYGTTVLELIPKAGEISTVEVIPRANVVPELSMVLDNVNVWGQGINYLEDPLYSRYLVPVGKVKSFGGLLVAAQYAIYKRGGFADWAQYMELFGMPFRIGKYNPYDEHTRTKLDQALKNMGAAGHIVIPDGSDLQFLFPPASTSAVDVYDRLIERANAEMSKLFLGNTLTTEQGENGARSLGDVHKQSEEEVVISDMKRIEFLLNWEMKERLLQFGYPVQDGDFTFTETVQLPLDKQIVIDMQLAQRVDIPDEYWYTRYGIPRPGSGDKVKVDGKEEEDPEEDLEEPDPEVREEVKKKPAATGKKKSPPVVALRAELAAYYAPLSLGEQPGGRDMQAAKGGMPKSILDRIIDRLVKTKQKQGWVDAELMQWTADQIIQHIMPGDGEVGDDAPTAPGLTEQQRKQVHVFSGFKTAHQLRQASALLFDKHGRVRPFSAFKRDILALDQEYNVRYLKAEWQLAGANVRAINRWNDLQAMKDVSPYARYSTAKDERVRDVHERLEGVIKHLDDPFWDVWWPPNGWGCRCIVVPEASDKGGRPVPKDIVPPKTMFANNVGKNGMLFPEGHPYAKQANERVRDQVESLAEAALFGGRNKVSRVAGSVPEDLAEDAALAFGAIDLVHAVRGMPLFSMVAVAMDFLGTYHAASKLMRIHPDGPHKALTILHETAHHLDRYVLGPGNEYGTLYGPRGKLKAVLKAMEDSDAVRQLKAMADAGEYVDEYGETIPLLDKARKDIETMLGPEEMFARAYAQYIALRSGSVRLNGQVKAILDIPGPDSQRQWDGTDFEAIAKAFDELFKGNRWKPLK